MGMVIYLIEDKIPNKDDTLSLLRQKIPQDLQNEISFEWLEGDGNMREIDDVPYHFYTESVLRQLESKKAELEAAGNSMGILLDLMLTEDEAKNEGRSFYPKVDLAKKIYFQYKDSVPIYIVTVLAVFGAQCDVIMGEDLSDQYVTKMELCEYKMEKSIKDLFRFYINFQNQG